MPVTLATVTLQASSGLMEDACVNQWVFFHATDQPAPGDTLDLSGPLNTFYNAIGGNLANSLARTAGGILYKFFDITAHLDGSPHGSPIATDTGQLLTAAISPTDLPSEVALCMTLRGLGWDGAPVEAVDGSDAGVEPDRPRQRHSGRLYFGPLNDTVKAAGGQRPSTATLTSIRDAYVTMKNSVAAAGYSPSVWSRKDAVTRRVVAVQTDNAYDIQRRRGVAPTARATTLVPA